MTRIPSWFLIIAAAVAAIAVGVVGVTAVFADKKDVASLPDREVLTEMHGG
jgi:hypothetical protein